MKKLVFAIQVFGIIAMFPLYVAIELNYGEKEFKGSQPPSVVAEKLWQNKVQVEIESKNKSNKSLFNLSNPGFIN